MKEGKIFAMLMPTLVFVLFAVITTVGAYLILAHHRGWKAGVLGGVIALLFFAGLFVGILALLKSWSQP